MGRGALSGQPPEWRVARREIGRGEKEGGRNNIIRFSVLILFLSRGVGVEAEDEDEDEDFDGCFFLRLGVIKGEIREKAVSA